MIHPALCSSVRSFFYITISVTGGFVSPPISLRPGSYPLFPSAPVFSSSSKAWQALMPPQHGYHHDTRTSTSCFSTRNKSWGKVTILKCKMTNYSEDHFYCHSPSAVPASFSHPQYKQEVGIGTDSIITPGANISNVKSLPFSVSEQCSVSTCLCHHGNFDLWSMPHKLS